ncbi:TonB-dependent receptor [Massilia aerilata]|uniref:TonB-dependent receptor n=1 Tax=Massilia aerilata TaxID=453817 RepID=A0ABW0RZ10_9BURK
MAHPTGPAACAAAVFLFLPFTAVAEETRAPFIPRVEVVGVAPVYGLGIERDLLPYPVQVATDKTMRKAGGENLAEFMAHHLGGVNVNEVSGSPFQNDITFRGFRASPVLGSSQGISVYLDGVRVNEPFGDVVNWDMVPEAAIGELILVTGANPLYGLNTLGGALAFRTKSGLTDPGGEAEFSLTSHGRRRADLAYGRQGAGGWHSFVGATLFDDEGWRDHSAGRLGNVLLKVGRAMGGTDWSATLLGGRSRVLGNGLLPDALYQADRRAVYTYPDTTRNRLLQGSFNFTRHIDPNSELSVVAYVRNSRRDTVNGDVSDDVEERAAEHPGVLNTTSTRQDGRGLNLAFSTRRGSVRLDAGANVDRSEVHYAQFEQAAFITEGREVIADPLESREPSSSVVGTSQAGGVYLAASLPVAPGTQLTASARYGRTRVANTLSNERGPQPAESFVYSRLNPSLGLTHVLSPRATLFANIAQGNRVPTVIELGCADPDNPCRLPVGLQSDPYLKQVVARTMEAGARGRFQDEDASGSYSLSLHRTVNRDDILFLSSPSRQGYFANFERTRHQGLDALLSRQSGRLGIRIAYSYLQAVYDADGELFTGARHVQVRRGTQMAGLPHHSAKLSLDWNLRPEWTIGADLHAVSSLVTQGNEDGLTADVEEGEAAQRADWRVHGYLLLGLRASYRPADKWELFARVSNVFDRRYESYGAVAPDLFPNGRLRAPQEEEGEAGHARFVAPGAPRTIVAGLRYRF